MSDPNVPDVNPRELRHMKDHGVDAERAIICAHQAATVIPPFRTAVAVRGFIKRFKFPSVYPLTWVESARSMK